MLEASEILTPIRVRLRELREEAKLTQEELAELTGARQATISNLETGKTRRIEFDLLESLVRVLSKALSRVVEPGELLERDKPGKKRR